MARRSNRGRGAEAADAPMVGADQALDPEAPSTHDAAPDTPPEMTDEEYKAARQATFQGGGQFAEAQDRWVQNFNDAWQHFDSIGLSDPKQHAARRNADKFKARDAEFNALLVLTPEEVMRARADIARQMVNDSSMPPDQVTIKERIDYVDPNYYGTFTDDRGRSGASLKVYASSNHNLDTLASKPGTKWIADTVATRCAEKGIDPKFAKGSIKITGCDLVQASDQYQAPFPNKGSLTMNADMGFLVGPITDDVARQRAFEGDPLTGEPINYQHYKYLNELAGGPDATREQRQAVAPDIATILRSRDGVYPDEVAAHALNTARIVETSHRAGYAPGTVMYTSAQARETVCRAAIGEQTPYQRDRGEPAQAPKGFVQVSKGGSFEASSPFGGMPQCERGLNPGAYLVVHRPVRRQRQPNGTTVMSSPTVKPDPEMAQMLENRRAALAASRGTRRDRGAGIGD